MNILKSELEKMNINIDNVVYTPRFYCTDIENILDENGKIVDFLYINVEIIETAEEFYQKESNKIDICPTKTLEQRLEEAEQKLAESEEEKKLLKAQVEVLSNTTDFHEELIAEMASKVYA